MFIKPTETVGSDPLNPIEVRIYWRLKGKRILVSRARSRREAARQLLSLRAISRSYRNAD